MTQLNSPRLSLKDENAPFDIDEWNTFVFWLQQWLRYSKWL